MLAIQKKLSPLFYILLSMPATAMGLALSVQIAALSWILSTQYHLSIEQVGLVWAAGPLAGIFGQIIIGLMSDNIWLLNGRRRPFILIGGTLAALMLLALPNIGVIASGIGTDELLGIAILVALTLDLSINISFNPTRSIIADVTPEGVERTKGYTWMQTVSGSFGMLAYAIGAVWGNYVLIYTGAILVLLLSLIPPLFIQEPKAISVHKTDNQQSFSIKSTLVLFKPLWGFVVYDLWAMTHRIFAWQVPEVVDYVLLLLALVWTLAILLKNRAAIDNSKATAHHYLSFQNILAAHSFSWIGVQTMFVYMFAYLQAEMPTLDDSSLGKVIAMSFLILSAVAALLPALALEPIAKYKGRVWVHTLCLFSMALGYILVAQFGHQQYVLYGLMALLGIGWSSIISLPFAIMSEQVNQTKMGLFMGIFNLSVVLPQLLVSTGVGLFVSQLTDKNHIFTLASISLLVSAASWLLVKEQAH